MAAGFKLVLGAAALWPVMFLLASQREPPGAPPIEPSNYPVPNNSIEERWDIPAATKGDRLPVSAPAPVVQQPEPLALASAADIEQARTQKPRERNKPAPERNICTRHGMHKVSTHGGRSWRCRR